MVQAWTSLVRFSLAVLTEWYIFAKIGLNHEQYIFSPHKQMIDKLVSTTINTSLSQSLFHLPYGGTYNHLSPITRPCEVMQ